MRSITKNAVLPLCVSLLLLSVCSGGGKQVAAEEEKKPSEYGETNTAITNESPRRIGVTATQSMTFKLLDSKGRELGKTHDFLCDIASGYITFVIFDLKDPELSRRGFYPVPSGLLRFDHSRNSYVINTSRDDVFKNATTIGGKISPGAFIQADIDIQQINVYWVDQGIMPPPRPKRAALQKEAEVYTFGFRILPGSNVSFRGMQGYDVINTNGQKIGEIENFLYNPFSERVYYVFVRFNDTSRKNRSYALPLDAFTLNFSDRTITFDLVQDMLVSAPFISSGQWEKVTNPDWIDQVHQYWLETNPVAALRRGMHIVPKTIMRETTLLGNEVINYQGETLGRIRDFVISDNGNVPYAITEVEDRWCFIPTTAITIDRLHSLALVDIPKNRLAAMSTYKPGALPDLNIPNWDIDIRAFWQSEVDPRVNALAPNLIISEIPEMTAKRTQNFLASALREYTVRGSEGDTLGEIEDLMLNMEEADAAYVVIAVGGFLDIGEKLFPIPVKAVSIMTGKDVVLNIQRKMLDQAPAFSSSEWLAMESPEQIKKVSDYWENILR